jgi:hypothetical protein
MDLEAQKKDKKKKKKELKSNVEITEETKQE